jgi:hypothetical protein
MVIKRSDKQYTEVESFEEYEFSSCIAYEMAIRHPRVIEILKYNFTKQNKPENYKAGEEYILFGLPDIYYLNYHFFKDIIDDNESNDYTFEYPLDDYTKEDEIHIHTFKRHKGFIRSSSVEKNDYNLGGTPFYTENLIQPWFKRPKIWVEKFDGTNRVELDLNLPANELTDFIKHIKKSYDKNIIKTPYEDLIESLPKQSHVSLSKGYKMADIFYVYDALKLGFTKKKIQIEVYNYYADKGIETRTLDYKTINKYHEFAIDYIDNKRYLELVTGKRIDDIKLETFYN